MCTSDTGNPRRRMALTAFVYLLISLFCALFGFVYECFSHEVYTLYMIYAFALPLAGGTLPYSCFALFFPRRYPGRAARNLYNAGIATLTVGSLFQGALVIYGTTNRLTWAYPIAGGLLLAAGILLYAFGKGESPAAPPKKDP